MSDLESLKNEYLQKVKISKSKNGSRNIIIFTTNSEQDVIDSLKERVITKKSIEVKNDINIISLTLKSVINNEVLNELYSHFIIHAGFKKKENIVDTTNDNRITQYYKNCCNHDNVNYNEFINLTKKEFFQKYRKITLSKNTIEAVNDYHEQLKLEKIKKRFDNIKWGSLNNKFQITVLEILKTEPHPRNIYIVEDVDGNNGKSFLCSYINTLYDILIVDGKPDNVYYQLSQMCKEGLDPTALIMDIPRESENYLQYNTIEKLKNGLVNSGKYESVKVNINPPHVFLFCNFNVRTDLWTNDRIKYINTQTGIITNINGEIEDIYGNVLNEEISDNKVSNEEIDYEKKYYELQKQIEKLKLENERIENLKFEIEALKYENKLLKESNKDDEEEDEKIIYELPEQEEEISDYEDE